MARLTPEQAQEKHARRLKGSIEDIRLGVERVTTSPTQLAAAKQDKMKMRLLSSIDSGKWAAGLKRVSLDEWKQKTINKGLNRIGAGIDEAAAKTTKFYGELLPYIDTVKAKVDKMSDVTLEDSIQRATTFIREMSKFQRKG